jgi:hypothetical protein
MSILQRLPSARKSRWTPDEDERLRALHRELSNDWAKIALGVPGRTNTGVKNRFKSGVFCQTQFLSDILDQKVLRGD